MAAPTCCAARWVRKSRKRWTRSVRSSERVALKTASTRPKAQRSLDLLDKFANYGFNKSHAAAYAVVSYQTAWLKANYPVEFMAGVMNCDLHLTDKLAVYFEEVRKRLEIASCRPASTALRRRSRWTRQAGLCAGRVEERRRRGDETDHRGAHDPRPDDRQSLRHALRSGPPRGS